MKRNKKISSISVIICLTIALLGGNFYVQNGDKELNSSLPTDGTQLVVDYIDVGQGDATLISKGEFHMLIDAGDNNAGETVVSFLKKRQIESLDIVVGTHPDADHIGGIDEVLGAFDVGCLYMPDEKKSTKTYEDVVKMAKTKQHMINMPIIGQEYKYGDNIVLRFLSPDSSMSSNSNNNSFVIQLAYGKTKFLFMGDAEESVEKHILKEGYALECDVLKLGHHGSASSTSLSFLKKADPTYAIISCGANNKYGHPHQETLAHLEDEDVQCYRTDKMGTVTVTSDGKSVHPSTQEASK